MSARYYDTARREVLPWLPERVARMLDVGCGAGATTAAVRETRAVEWAGGVEYVEKIAAEAEARLDRVWRGDAAQAPLEAEIAASSLDLVLCLDVLEHMADPWTMVRRLSTLVAPGGRLILSVPNVRHWKFLWRLFALGDFIYRDAGLLDRTHLRFFVRRTAVELATCGGLSLVAAVSAQSWRFPEPRWWLARASASRLDELIAKQWLVVAEKPVGPARLA
jgi:2-polyprenyl-3-methyl-5-hydroxy-6-metoxy-1,4-benzoquinol methylase